MGDDWSLSPEERAEGEYFEALYGRWESFDPPAAREFLAGFDRPWWIVGGWSIEAFVGTPREHEDVDVSFFACDVPRLREHVGMRWQLWNVASGTLRPLTDRWPEPVAPDSQVWVRRHATSPWVLDMPMTPDRDGLWTNKRLPDDARPLDEATWVATDGIRYLNPEITLLFKARLDRPKDQRDLDRVLPLLGDEQRAWLRDAVRTLDEAHPWLERQDLR